MKLQELRAPGKPNEVKSTVIATGATLINSALHIEALQNRLKLRMLLITPTGRIEHSSECLYSVNTRMCVDQRCLYSKNPLLESGTPGTKGNTNMIVPHSTKIWYINRSTRETGTHVYCALIFAQH
ncbi:hypothetical protein POM88_017086 [Heracleum sosnowskyi]|uniref:THIF-type NAD/FAD binding fold domain-containing protein n=1 Tax=Heracleum sosnowskyi TaxID=360622 RepID=A0AAD8MZ23_9APIA|nr:hypothetical protein POM88_017086 [Heracleum sosnowskyi]